MISKKIIVALVVAIIAIGAIFLVLPDKKNNNSSASVTSDRSTQKPATDQPNASSDTAVYTTVQVAEHNSKDDCWTIINGNVYNLTSFIEEHPGGEEILRACGTDASTLFNQRETSNGEEVGSGTPHSSDARSELARLKVGTLAE